VAEYRDRQTAWYFTRADGEPMTFAGLWDEWKDKTTGEVLKSCTMLIAEPNDFVAEVHDRTPVVLESKDFAPWLNGGGPALLKPAANDVLQRWPVSRRVNSSRAPADDPTPRRTGRGELADQMSWANTSGLRRGSTGTGNGSKPIMRARPSPMSQGRSFMAALSAAGALPQSITRRIGTPSNHERHQGHRRVALVRRIASDNDSSRK
jgi:hypothetical protein